MGCNWGCIAVIGIGIEVGEGHGIVTGIVVAIVIVSGAVVVIVVDSID